MTVFTIKAKNKKQASKIKAALKLIEVEFSTSENDQFYPEIEKRQVTALKDKK